MHSARTEPKIDPAVHTRLFRYTSESPGKVFDPAREPRDSQLAAEMPIPPSPPGYVFELECHARVVFGGLHRKRVFSASDRQV